MKHQNVESNGRSLHTIKSNVFERLSSTGVMAAMTIIPTGVLFAFIVLLPISWAILASFHVIPAFNPQWTWVGLDNYRSVLEEPEFFASLGRSAVFSIGSVALQVGVGTAIALVINEKFRFTSIIRAFVLIPYLVPTAIVGFLTLWMANSNWGIIGQGLLALGFVDTIPSFFGSRELAMISVIVTNSWKFSIFVTILVLAKLQSIPDDYYEVASVSGANFYEKFRDITLPNLKAVLFIAILLRSIWMFNKFDIIWVMTRGGPDEATTTLPVYAYLIAFNRLRLGEAAAISTLIFIMIGVGALLYFRIFEPSKEVNVE